MDHYLKQADAAAMRDPRSAPFGIWAGGSFVMDSVRVFSWFESLNDMAIHLADVMPKLYDFDDDDLRQYHDAVNPLLDQLRRMGPTEDWRAAFNQVVAESFVLDWCGRFEELASEATPFALEVRGDFKPSNNAPLKPSEIDEFVEFLREYGI
jgi:hypothetical protein